MSKLKNNNDKGSFFHNLATQRRFRYGGFAILITCIALAAVILLNMVLGMVEDNWALSIDLSPSRVTKFDDATIETLKEVDKDLVIYLLYQQDNQSVLRAELEEMAKKYHALNNRISYDFIDPYTEPAKLARYVDTNTTSLAEGSIIISRSDDSKFRVINRTDLYRYSYVEDKTSQWGYRYAQAFDGEAKLTSAIKYVNSENTPNVYFLTGHNEIDMDHMTVFAGNLKSENYNVQSLTLGTGVELGRGDTIAIVNPLVDLTDDEYAELSAWLQDGGRLLMTLDNQVKTSDLKNFSALLAIYQLSFGDGYVVEDANATSSWISTPVMVLPTVNAESDITKVLVENNLRTIVYGGRPINRCDMPLSGVIYDVLLSSSDRSYVKPADSKTALTDRTDASAEGSQILAYSAIRQPDVYDREQDTRIMLMSSAYMFADTNILNQSYNMQFSMAAVEWLVNRDVSVYVRASQIIETALTIPDETTTIVIGVVVIGVIPLIVATAGVVVWMRRRRL